MTRSLVDRIADAVLYEGYLLYPYRPSSAKNRQRWTFGGLFPRDCDLARCGQEPSSLQAECMVEGSPDTVVHVRTRFLHLIERAAGGQVWQEAEDREVVSPEARLEQLAASGVRNEFAFPSRSTRERGWDIDGEEVGEFLRKQSAVSGVVEIAAFPIQEGLFRLRIHVVNSTPLKSADGGREELLPAALVSTHAIFTVTEGAFVSLIDPPEQHRGVVSECRNVGVWPVMVGEPGERHTMLASPIILYDYPQLAPESPGDLFDATEIDEILTLRILTMTDDEKRQMRAADPRADALLSRTEALAHEELMRLHGTMREVRTLGNGGTP
jgi:hypothetical protein